MDATARRQPTHRGDFEIAVICALPTESRAVAALFDGWWDDYGKSLGDENSYRTGWIGKHNVVLVHLPGMGKVAAATAAAQLRSTYPSVRLCVVVGICGGVPTRTARGEIMLGDVLISTGLVQYDYGKIYPDGLKRKNSYEDNLSRPNTEIRSFLHRLQSDDVEALSQDTIKYLFAGSARAGFPNLDSPPPEEDKLYPPEYRHKHQVAGLCSICDGCVQFGDPVCADSLVSHCLELGCNCFTVRSRHIISGPRPPPLIHFGSFGSGDAVMKSGRDRDRISGKENVIGFEMEGAGVWQLLPTIVLKSVCDYADSHKSKSWQEYAATVAASCLKALLSRWSFSYQLAQPTYLEAPHALPSPQELQSSSASLVFMDRLTTDAKRSEECLQSLSFPEMFTRQNKTRDAATGTFTWLQEHSAYTKWAGQRRGLLWIQGKPGAGKSTLMNHALDLSKRRSECLLVSFFFDGAGAALQRSQLGLYRSLLHQILARVPQLRDQFAFSFGERWTTRGIPGKAWDWEVKELQDFLKHSVMSSHAAPAIRIFVDALDESGEENAVQIASFFEDLSSSCNPILGNPSICFSCRHYPNIRISQDDDLVICLEQENGGDIDTYVNTTLRPAFAKDVCPDGLISQILDRAAGVFQWVVLVVERVLKLRRYRRPIDVMFKEIRATPRDLHKLYAKILEDVSSEDNQSTLKLLQWICFAKRPLTLDELALAMSIDANTPYSSMREYEESVRVMSAEEMGEEAKRLSAGLVELWTENGKSALSVGKTRARLIHQSVYDFLIGGGLQNLSSKSTVAADAQYQLSRSCLRLLALEDILVTVHSDVHPSGRQPLVERLPLLFYALDYWMYHARETEAYMDQDDVLELCQWPSNTFMEAYAFASHSCYSTSTSRRKDDFKMTGTSTLLHVVCYYGMSGYLRAMLKRISLLESAVHSPAVEIPSVVAPTEVMEARTQAFDWDYIDAKDGYSRSPLSFAAQRGHIAVVNQLLATGKVDVESKDLLGNTPLIHAAENGHADVVRHLLTTGRADPTDTNIIGYGPVAEAARSCCVPGIKQLLAMGSSHLDSRSALCLAAGRGYLEVVRLLIDSGVDVATNDHDDRIPTYFRNPCSYAAKYGHIEILRLLLATGKVDVQRIDSTGRTLLMYLPHHLQGSKAAQLMEIANSSASVRKMNHADVPSNSELESFAMKLLSSDHFNVSSKDVFGRNILSWAAGWGSRHRADNSGYASPTGCQLERWEWPGHPILGDQLGLGRCCRTITGFGACQAISG